MTNRQVILHHHDMKRNAVIAALLLLVVFAFSACAGAALDGQTADGAPAFLRDIGKTLSDLKSEQPAGKVIVSLGSFPDSAAICFGEDAEYAHFFFGTQSGDAEKAMSECEKALKCAGFVTTAGVLFPDMDEEMSFDAFFSLIGVDEYEYFGEEMVATGWLRFLYDGMEVWANTNEANADGG